MAHQIFPSPSINPLQRLHVYDSLMMNAERWHLAHYYHRHRQNIHYQSLNDPGVVSGLGVRVTAPPDDAPAKFRDQRWLEIQPGIAIDLEGNPIIVDSSIDRRFRISTAAPTTGSVTVYLVTSYVEPQNPGLRQSSDLIREWFRFDEKTSPPNEREIELCRIRLSPGTVQLENPTDVLFPEVNQLDLRYRPQAKARPQSVVRLATTLNASDRTFYNLAYLMQSVEVLYPALQGVTPIGQIMLTEVNDYDLVYLTAWQALHLEPAELNALSQYLQTGGVILIEVSSKSSKLTRDIKNLIADEFQITMQTWQTLNNQHPLRTQPFLFAALGRINEKNIQLSYGGGIILLEGDLSDAWGIDDNLTLERNDIRTAQELGINILNFALQRRKITLQLLGS
ncbi:hypothetical protein WA1_19820 [Scytonema hofmannii PCC 7110]|uniref:DUF4159 domain-containing protein n=1 Tax=Scytonema hofmannii PCC 7110 TaxID=128403 RepID=A0A139XC07_9CYAN|nr:DUF4159 domain-containing protein [Scytonema hofmannii]KYC42230.1 hypothetical protein WA1_19820 [Scytonema hofmannii PCC 7110]